MAKSVPPSLMSGAASLAMRMNEWQEMSMARAKPSAVQSMRPPCRSPFGAQAIECTTMSSRPHSRAMRSKSASSSPGCDTSSGATIGASSFRASGST